MLQDFALANIIKYAYRNRRRFTKKRVSISSSDMDKIIHYAEMVKFLKEEADEHGGWQGVEAMSEDTKGPNSHPHGDLPDKGD